MAKRPAPAAPRGILDNRATAPPEARLSNAQREALYAEMNARADEVESMASALVKRCSRSLWWAFATGVLAGLAIMWGVG